MKRYLMAAVAALAMTGAAHAAPVIDGAYDAAYGASTATVTYNANALDTNFGQCPNNACDPSNQTRFAGYDIYLTSDSSFVYALLQQNGTGGTSAGTFANLYFDLNPAANNGSDLGFELGPNSQDVFIPNTGQKLITTDIQRAANADGSGFEVAIPISYFNSAIPGLTYDPAVTFPNGNSVVLRLSQTFGYSVAGGGSYGPTRLGAVAIGGAAPEPGTWALMTLGVGLAGVALRRRRQAELRAAAA